MATHHTFPGEHTLVRDEQSAGSLTGITEAARWTPEAAEADDTLTAGRREWMRLADSSAATRITLVVDLVWQREYPAAYHAAYAGVASQITQEVARAAVANPHAWMTLHHLTGAAIDALTRRDTHTFLAPPADRRTLTAGRRAAEQSGQPEPWTAVAQAALAGTVTAARIAGALTAATDVVTGWRTRGGDRLAADALVDGQPARAWVADLLAGINRDTILAARPAAPAATTAAGLARQDTAAPAAGPAAATGRRDSRSAAAPSTTARARSR
ncbi:MAG: hypothetical protein V7603_5076 [Micromonosporaceae bacterium]